MGSKTEAPRPPERYGRSTEAASGAPQAPHPDSLERSSKFNDNVKRRLSRYSYGTRLSFSSLDEDTAEDLAYEIEDLQDAPESPPSPKVQHSRPDPVLNSPIEQPKPKKDAPRKSLIESLSSSKSKKRSLAEFESSHQGQRLNLDSEAEITQRPKKRTRPNLSHVTQSHSLFMPYTDPITGFNSEEQVFFPRDLWRLNPDGFSDTQLLKTDTFELTVIQVAPGYSVNIKTGSETITATVLAAQTFCLEATVGPKSMQLSQWETFVVLPYCSCSITNHGTSIRAKLQLSISKPNALN